MKDLRLRSYGRLLFLFLPFTISQVPVPFPFFSQSPFRINKKAKINSLPTPKKLCKNTYCKKCHELWCVILQMASPSPFPNSPPHSSPPGPQNIFKPLTFCYKVISQKYAINAHTKMIPFCNKEKEGF